MNIQKTWLMKDRVVENNHVLTVIRQISSGIFDGVSIEFWDCLDRDLMEFRQCFDGSTFPNREHWHFVRFSMVFFWSCSFFASSIFFLGLPYHEMRPNHATLLRFRWHFWEVLELSSVRFGLFLMTSLAGTCWK